jgi:CheY-like chemotaxis protein
MRILAVDDNETSRETLRQQIESWGLTAATAGDAAAALDLMGRAVRGGKPYDVVLIDGDMPGTDGAQLGRAIREDPAMDGTVLMMLVSMDEPVDPAGLRAMGFSGHMTKPVRQSQLFDSIMNAIAQAAGLAGAQAAQGGVDAVAAATDVQTEKWRGRVLLAEDNRVNQIVAGEILAKAGFTYDLVDDGQKAVEAVRRGGYDVVILDCQMPVLDGFEAAQAIRADELAGAGGRRVPIVALTANAIKGDRERCMAAGMDAYCSKPVDARRLVETIESLLVEVGATTVPEVESLAGEIAATQASEGCETPLDVDALFGRCMSSAAIARQVLDEFERQAIADLQRLRESVIAGDAPGTARVAHALKGAAGVATADGMRRVATDLERLGREGNLSAAATLLPQLEAEVSRCVEYLPEARAAMDGR